MSKRKKFIRILLKVLAGVLTVVLIAAVCILLVLAQPKKEDTEKPAPQPLLTASPALSISSETELRSLVKAFPVPVLSFMSGSGMLFVSGTSAGWPPCTGKPRRANPSFSRAFIRPPPFRCWAPDIISAPLPAPRSLAWIPSGWRTRIPYVSTPQRSPAFTRLRFRSPPRPGSPP